MNKKYINENAQNNSFIIFYLNHLLKWNLMLFWLQNLFMIESIINSATQAMCGSCSDQINWWGYIYIYIYIYINKTTAATELSPIILRKLLSFNFTSHYLRSVYIKQY